MAGFSRGPTDPPGLIRALEAAIDRGGASWGMEAAFEEFRTSFRAGAASTDHRFWRFVLSTARPSDRSGRHKAIVELGFDEDARFSIMIGSGEEDITLMAVDNLGAAMQSDLVMRSLNLAASANRGIIFFLQVGMARWRAEPNPPLSSASIVHLAFSEVWIDRVRGAAIRLTQSGNWFLTELPISTRKVESIL